MDPSASMAQALMPQKLEATPGEPGSGMTYYNYMPDQEAAAAQTAAQAQHSQFGGLPPDIAANYAGTPAGDPGNWHLSRADAQSPLAYANRNSNWQPNDEGGYYTTMQLMQATQPPQWIDPMQGMDPNDPINQGRSRTPYRATPTIPGEFGRGYDAPSTNNWRLTVPFGGGPDNILRNGFLINRPMAALPLAQDNQNYGPPQKVFNAASVGLPVGVSNGGWSDSTWWAGWPGGGAADHGGGQRT